MSNPFPLRDYWAELIDKLASPGGGSLPPLAQTPRKPAEPKALKKSPTTKNTKPGKKKKNKKRRAKARWVKFVQGGAPGLGKRA